MGLRQWFDLKIKKSYGWTDRKGGGGLQMENECEAAIKQREVVK